MSARDARYDPSRYSTRGRDYQDDEHDPEDFRAYVELTDLPSALTQDPIVGARFITHYFIKITHFPVEDVLLAVESKPEPPSRLEAGEIARPCKPVCLMTLTSREAWDRLRRVSDPPRTRQNERITFSDTTVVWEHDILSKHAPEWSNMTKVQGGGTVISLKDKLYGKKFRFQLLSLDVTTTLPATALLPHEQKSHKSPVRRDIAASAADPLAWAPQALPKPYLPFGSPKNNRPSSWDIPDATDMNGMEGTAVDGGTSARQWVDERHPEYRIGPDEVGHMKHDNSTDPWMERIKDQRYSNAEENYQWLDAHRQYLLATELGKKTLPMTIPFFPPKRTIVTWQLPKFMTRKHLAVFFSQFGRVDDVKIRTMPEGWSPAGRIAFVAFMTERDCREVLRKVTGVMFPKATEELRKSRNWQEYDDFTRFPSKHLPVAEAVKGEWCPVASQLVNGKLADPAMRARQPSARERPPGGDAFNRADDAASSFHPLPGGADPSAHATAAGSGSASRSQSRDRRLRSQTPREYTKITIPVRLPEKTVPPQDAQKLIGEKRLERRRMGVLAIPQGATVTQLRTILEATFGLIKPIFLSTSADIPYKVEFTSDKGIEKAEKDAKRTNAHGRFKNCFELTVPLVGLEAEHETRWAEWKWKDGGKDSPETDEQQSHATLDSSHSLPSSTSARMQTQNVTSEELPPLTIDELDAFVDHGTMPLTTSMVPASSREQSPPPPLPQPSSRPPAVLASSATHAKPETAPIESHSQKRPGPETFVRQSPAPLARASMFQRSFRAAGKAAGSAMAILMANQPDIEQPEKRPSLSSSAVDSASAKRQRYE
ncbi:hypothetical protein NliqN6_2866 [Naganishia liquefaciens]|uniref:RRM domain-containing protein n=1 Tax=Naganishia liquefaciens TaxID=104408 RepID=A0A8H3TUM3_9TREE|nr:hypothetical protein NliqN6_2866 [Naganishia liquefaciens]